MTVEGWGQVRAEGGGAPTSISEGRNILFMRTIRGEEKRISKAEAEWGGGYRSKGYSWGGGSNPFFWGLKAGRLAEEERRNMRSPREAFAEATHEEGYKKTKRGGRAQTKEKLPEGVQGGVSVGRGRRERYRPL